MLVGIARVESGLNTDAIHANTNGSRDWGITQINDTNFALLGINAQSALDPCVSFAASARLLALFSRYNTGSPTRGIASGYAGNVLQATRITARGQPGSAAAFPPSVDLESSPGAGEIIFTTRESRP